MAASKIISENEAYTIMEVGILGLMLVVSSVVQEKVWPARLATLCSYSTWQSVITLSVGPRL